MTVSTSRRSVLRAGAGLAGAALTEFGARNSAWAQDDSKTITVTGISSFGLIADQIPRFTAATGIKVNLEILPYPQLRTRSMADLVGGTAASDIYLQDIIWLGEWATNGYVRPIDDLLARDAAEIGADDMLPGAFNAMSRWNSKTWSVPIGAFYFLNYYRSDWFADKKLSAPATFADVDRDAATLTDAKDNRFGIAMAYQKGTPITSWFLATYAGAGGKLLTDPPKNFRPTLDSDLAKTVFGHYIGWEKSSPRGVVGYHWNDQTTAMQNGRIAMAPTFSVNGTEFAKPDKSQAAGSLGYTYMPRVNATDPTIVPFGGWAAAINAKSTKTEAAWAFMKFLISPQTQFELAKVSGTPVRYSTLANADLQKLYPWLGFVLAAEKAGLIYPDYRPRYPFYPKIEEAIGTQLNLAALGQAEPGDALMKANEAAAEIIREAGYPVG